MKLPDRLVLATHNKGKIAELTALLAPLGVEVVLAADLGLAEPEETGTTCRENAILKAETACDATGLAALADDSGFCVDALDGAPGVYTADWAGVPRDYSVGMARVLRELVDVGATEPAARRGAFVAVLALARPGEPTAIFEGRAPGVVASEPRGEGGFGFDPLFVPDDGDGRTFAEMTPAEKHGGAKPLSHRARAVANFMAAVAQP